MALKRRLFAGGVTLVIAAAVGFVMQNGDQLKALIGGGTPPKRVAAAKAPPAPAKPAVVATAALDSATVVPLAASASADPDPEPVQGALPVLPEDIAGDLGPAPVVSELPTRIAGLDQNHSRPATDAQDYDQFGLKCEGTLTAEPSGAGMVRLTLATPCKPNARLSVFHDILHFSAATDVNGTMSVALPALVADAAFMVQFADDSILSAYTQVPEAPDYAHVALQWQGRNAMQIHAYEFGAEYGQPGHVWQGAPSSAQGAGGFLVELGDVQVPFAKMAQIYSFPKAVSANDGTVEIMVEAEVTAANCGREISAEALQPDADGRLQPAELTLFMPDCDAKGEFLVLKNVLQDMKIARN